MEKMRQFFRLNPPDSPEPGRRVVVLDVMRGLLILAMVFSHTQAGLNLNFSWPVPDKWPLQIVIFPGLLFAFGYSVHKAYLEKPALPWRRVLRNVFRILAAYALCAFAYMVLEARLFSLRYFLSLLRLDLMVYIAEFLLTYAILLLLLLAVPAFFRQVPGRDFLFWPVVTGLLLTTLIDYSQIKSVYLALFIGSGSVTTYPVVQYLPFFLFGIYFARRQVRFSWKFLTGALLALAVFLVARQHGLTSRFPPSLFWMLGSLGAVYVCYLLAALVARLSFLQKPLSDVGRRTLYWFVMSNLIIYALAAAMKPLTLPVYWTAVILFGSVFFIAFLGSLARK